MKLIIALLAMAGAFLGTPARAEFVSGNVLYDWCTTPRSSAVYYQNESSCREYILGVHDGMEAAGMLVTRIAELENPFRIVCVPDRVQARQATEIVVNHLRTHPESRHEGASFQVSLALMDAYPCPRSG